MNSKENLFKYILHLGDDALILGHRLSELCSKGPILEEDLALTNIALDMIGRAQALLRYAGEVEAKGRTEDEIAYRRPESQYYNRLITEQPNGDFAHIMARQLYTLYLNSCFTRTLRKATTKRLLLSLPKP
jgi:ring-1,2-phenylacetyl-CoA epoxidase subunit PaaC